jgi:inosine-uridine nucleoside N-ribohydrolase
MGHVLMAKKVILIADPGIDTAFAVALAFADPNLDVIGLLPTAGNVSALQASSNINILISELDPPKWPRTASPLPLSFPRDGTALHGPNGLGGVSFPTTERHQQLPADKALVELVHEHPHDVTIISFGPPTTVARALDRDAELSSMIDRLILIGGTWREPGNAGPVTEFHFSLDAEAAQRCLESGLHPIVIPLDISRRLMMAPSDLLDLPNGDSRTCRFLRKIVPFGIRASSHLYGVEGFHLKDVLGVVAVALPGTITTEPYPVEIETRSGLTQGMMVVDARVGTAATPNVRLGVDVAIGEIRQYIDRILNQAP